MKVKELFEILEIQYNDGKIQTGIFDFLKQNNIKDIEIAAAVKKVRQSEPYKELISKGFDEIQTDVQLKRGTLVLSIDLQKMRKRDSEGKISSDEFRNYMYIKRVFTCFPNGVARIQTSKQSISRDLKVDKPTQITDLPNVVDVLAANLMMSIATCAAYVRKLEKEKIRSVEKFEIESEKFKKLGIPPGVQLSTSSAFSSSSRLDFIKKGKNGTFRLNAKRFETIYFRFDNGVNKLPFVISEVKNVDEKNDVISIAIDAAPSLNTFEGFPKNLHFLSFHVTPNLTLLDAAEYFDQVTNLRIINDSQRLDFPLMPLIKIKGLNAITFKNATSNSAEVGNIFNNFFKGKIDAFEVQDKLEDLGLKNAAKLK